MKILLIGEFSGVHNNLKQSLLELGHDVKLAAEGDGYRKFGYDYNIAPYKGRFVGRILNVFYFIFNIRKFIRFDVVQFISPFSVPYYFHFFGLTHILFKMNKIKVYYACGTDPAYVAAKNKFEYFPFNVKNSPDNPRYNKFSLLYYRWFIDHINHIVPSMYSYAIGNWDNPKLGKPIPLPGSNKNIFKLTESNVKKVKILFGITRRDFKGSKYILEALELIKKKYENIVNITIVEKIPFNDYILLLNNADILIDQCKSYDYGMNAIFAMQHGCVVLSGSEKTSMDYLEFENCPVINILPNKINIFSKIEAIIQLSNTEMNKLRSETINFVKVNHSSKRIASKFIVSYEKLQ